MNSKDGKARLDHILVDRGIFPSRARAQGAIKAGLIKVAGAVIDKSATILRADVEIDVAGDVHDYVSRGALKLAHALETFGITAEGKTCLDLGASTGGFTEVLLRAGARLVYAVDVGTGQLHSRFASDTRLVNLEKTHSKDISRALVPDAVGLIVCDVSFISLKKALPPALALAAANAALIVLVKPQFELGRDKIGRGGLVTARADEFDLLIADIKNWLVAEGWVIKGAIDSPIAGGDGNKEFLIGAVRSA
jgi:23S rRNA (cytidine1920-2'-O)/16S rRNA (cytidine1409-2'-O)-methyltransferase